MNSPAITNAPLPDTAVVGIAGLGTMGRAMAARLRRRFPLALFNRTGRVLQTFAQSADVLAASPRDLAERSRFVLISLAGADATESVLFDAELGLSQARNRPLTVIDTSTLSPAHAQDVEHRLRAKGISYVDCPVSGGPANARRGRLVAIVSGLAADIDSALPVIRTFSRHVVMAGRSGEAQTLKLLNNAAEAINLLGAAETISLGRQLGIPLSTLTEVLTRARGRSPYMSLLLRWLNAGSPGAVQGTFAVRVKDIRLVKRLGVDCSANTPLLDEVLQAFESVARSVGWNEDQFNVISYFRERGTRPAKLESADVVR